MPIRLRTVHVVLPVLHRLKRPPPDADNKYHDTNVGDGMDPGAISMTDVDGGATSNGGIMVELSCQPSAPGVGDDDDEHDDELGRVPLLESGNNNIHQGSHLSSSS